MNAAPRANLEGRHLLLVVAAPSEARAILGARPEPAPWRPTPVSSGFDLVLSGVGKANAAGATAAAIATSRYAAVLSVGIAGAYGDLPIGAAVAGVAAVYADEGVQASDGFTDIAALGFPPADLPGVRFPADPELFQVLRTLADASGVIATVSTCSGTDALAAERAARTGAIAECMEGAAVLHAAHRLGVPAAELRVISNTTGDRPRQVWNMGLALSKLADVIGRLRA
jgi:futalosine hydrolase